MPGQDFSILAWFAFVPLFLVLRNRSLGSSFSLAFLCGFGANAGILHWLAISPEISTIEFLVIAGYLGLHWGLFGLAVAYVTARSPIPLVVSAPVLWVVFEYLQSSFFPIELPWSLLGHSQYQNIALMQMAAITGVYGISYVIVLVNSLITESLVGDRHAIGCSAVILVIVGVALVAGHLVLADSSHARTIAATVVPGNVAQEVKWDQTRQEANFQRYLEESRRAVEATATALVVWPETSVPLLLNRDLHSLGMLRNLTDETQTSLLIGSGEREKFAEGRKDKAKRYNSAVLIGPNTSEIRSYHKIRLFPFGEYLPWERFLPWPSRYRTHSSQFDPGDDYTMFTLLAGEDAIPFSVLICWEGMFPNLVRQFVQQGATFLVGISNEAWFDGAFAPQFLAMNTFRAVENRRALVRAVNGGISGFIDPYGRLMASMTPDQDRHSSGGFLTHSIPLVRTITFYTMYGDVFAQALTAASCLFILSPFRKRRPVEMEVACGQAFFREQQSSEHVRLRQGRVTGR